MKAIQTESLTKYYGKARGIIDVSLSVEEGDFFGFIGPNGAGKSTFIRTLLGLISPTSGKGEIFGRDIVKESVENLTDIGYLPAEAAFYQKGYILTFSISDKKKYRLSSFKLSRYLFYFSSFSVLSDTVLSVMGSLFVSFFS